MHVAVVSVRGLDRSECNVRNANLCPLQHGDCPHIDIYPTVFSSAFLVISTKVM